MAQIQHEVNEFLGVAKVNRMGPFSIVEKGKHKKQSQVYVLRCGRFYKIGQTVGNITTRVSELQVGNPEKIEIMFTVETDNPKNMEAHLHEFYKDQRVKGEWFELTEEHINEILSAVMVNWAKKVTGCKCT